MYIHGGSQTSGLGCIENSIYFINLLFIFNLYCKVYVRKWNFLSWLRNSVVSSYGMYWYIYSTHKVQQCKIVPFQYKLSLSDEPTCISFELDCHIAHECIISVRNFGSVHMHPAQEIVVQNLYWQVAEACASCQCTESTSQQHPPSAKD